MKPRHFFCLMIAAGVLGAAESPKAPAARPRLFGTAGRAVPETLAASAAPAATAENSVVVMAPVRVTGATVPIDRRPEESPKEQPFTWKEGGTIWKNHGPNVTTELKFQYNPVHRGFDLLSFSW